MLTKLVNGKRVRVDGSEEAAIRAEWNRPPDPEPSLRDKIIGRLRSDPIARAQVVELRDRRGLTNGQVLDFLEQKAGEAIE